MNNKNINTKQPLCFETCRDCLEMDAIANIKDYWLLRREAEEHQRSTGHKTLVYREDEL